MHIKDSLLSNPLQRVQPIVNAYMSVYPVDQVIQPRNLSQMTAHVHLFPFFYSLYFLRTSQSIVEHHALIHRVRNRRDQVSAETISQTLLPRRRVLCFVLSEIGVAGRALGIGDERGDFWGCSRSWSRDFVGFGWSCGYRFGRWMVEELERVADSEVGLFVGGRRTLAGSGGFESLIIGEGYFEGINFLAQVSHGRLLFKFQQQRKSSLLHLKGRIFQTNHNISCRLVSHLTSTILENDALYLSSQMQIYAQILLDSRIKLSFLDIFQLRKKLIEILQAVIFASFAFKAIYRLQANCYTFLLGALTFLTATLGELRAYFTSRFQALIVTLIQRPTPAISQFAEPLYPLMGSHLYLDGAYNQYENKDALDQHCYGNYEVNKYY